MTSKKLHIITVSKNIYINLFPFFFFFSLIVTHVVHIDRQSIKLTCRQSPVLLVDGSEKGPPPEDKAALFGGGGGGGLGERGGGGRGGEGHRGGGRGQGGGAGSGQGGGACVLQRRVARQQLLEDRAHLPTDQLLEGEEREREREIEREGLGGVRWGDQASGRGGLNHQVCVCVVKC